MDRLFITVLCPKGWISETFEILNLSWLLRLFFSPLQFQHKQTGINFILGLASIGSFEKLTPGYLPFLDLFFLLQIEEWMGQNASTSTSTPPLPPPTAPPPPSAPVSTGSPPKTKSRGTLLSEIHKGAKLKKTVTNDRSAPYLHGKRPFFCYFAVAIRLKNC